MSDGKKPNIPRTARECWEEVMKFNSEFQPGGFRKAYAKVRDAFIHGIEQDVELGQMLEDRPERPARTGLQGLRILPSLFKRPAVCRLSSAGRARDL